MLTTITIPKIMQLYPQSSIGGLVIPTNDLRLRSTFMSHLLDLLQSNEEWLRIYHRVSPPNIWAVQEETNGLKQYLRHSHRTTKMIVPMAHHGYCVLPITMKCNIRGTPMKHVWV